MWVGSGAGKVRVVERKKRTGRIEIKKGPLCDALGAGEVSDPVCGRTQESRRVPLMALNASGSDKTKRARLVSLSRTPRAVSDLDQPGQQGYPLFFTL